MDILREAIEVVRKYDEGEPLEVMKPDDLLPTWAVIALLCALFVAVCLGCAFVGWIVL